MHLLLSRLNFLEIQLVSTCVVPYSELLTTNCLIPLVLFTPLRISINLSNQTVRGNEL